MRKTFQRREKASRADVKGDTVKGDVQNWVPENKHDADRVSSPRSRDLSKRTGMRRGRKYTATRRAGHKIRKTFQRRGEASRADVKDEAVNSTSEKFSDADRFSASRSSDP